jgi:hypothetical protein
MSALYRKQFPTIHLESFYVCINILVERVTCSVWTSNSLALTMLMGPILLVDRESKSIYQ